MGAGCAVFVPIEQKLHVSSGEPIAHVTLADTQDSSNPTQYVPFWNIQFLKSTSQKLDMYFLSPFGSSSTVVPKFFMCGRENRMGTSPVSTSSTLVEIKVLSESE